MGRDAHEHKLVRRAWQPPGPEPYDVAQPFNADELFDGFTVERRQVRADPRAVMAVLSGLRLAGCPHAVSCLSVGQCRERR